MQDTFVRLIKTISITSISPHKREREYYLAIESFDFRSNFIGQCIWRES